MGLFDGSGVEAKSPRPRPAPSSTAPHTRARRGCGHRGVEGLVSATSCDARNTGNTAGCHDRSERFESHVIENQTCVHGKSCRRRALQVRSRSLPLLPAGESMARIGGILACGHTYLRDELLVTRHRRDECIVQGRVLLGQKERPLRRQPPILRRCVDRHKRNRGSHICKVHIH